MSDQAVPDADAARDQLRRILARAESSVRAVPMSFAQERLWFLDQLVPGNPFYNVDVAIRLRGPLAAGALEQALLEICQRHEALRTTFGSIDGTPTQFVHRRPALRLERRSLDAGPDLTRRALEVIRDEARRPFDLTRGPVMRGSLLQLAADDHVLMLTLHHIVSDGWSMGVLIHELAALYNAFRAGQPSPLPPVPIQYPDYANWQRKRLTGELLRAELDYWKTQLAVLPHLELPTDRPRPALPTFSGRRLYFDVPAAIARRVRELGREQGTTLFMTLLAAFQVLLYRDSGQDDLVIGTPIAGRNRAELEPLIGFFVNTLVIRTRIRGERSFRSLLGEVREVALDAFAHQELPFERLVEELHPDRDLSRNPLCQVVFSLQNTPTSMLALDRLEVSFPSVASETTRFDLVLDVWESAGDDALHARLEYSRDLFDEATVEAMGRRLVTLLDAIVASPDAPLNGLPVLTPAERHRITVEWNDTGAPLPIAAGVHELVRRRSVEVPERLAVSDRVRHITYGALEREAGQLASYLTSLGAGPERLVAVCLEPSVDWAVTLLAVLKCGAAYVALDPALPRERLLRMLDAAAPVAVVTSEQAGDWLRADGRAAIYVDTDREAIARPRDWVPSAPGTAAYVIFTSGSSGEANGVRVGHRGLLNLVAWHQRCYAVVPDDRASQVAGPGFDASVWELWPYLAAGASVHIADRAIRHDPARLMRWMADDRLTLTFLPTPLAEAALAGPLPTGLTLRAMFTGGDRLLRAPRGPLPFTLFNHYGPTEYSVVATVAEIRPCHDHDEGRDCAPPIGRPIANTQVYVLDARGELAPPRVPGELTIAGAGLASGYLGLDQLTAERFVDNPFAAGEQAQRDGADRPRMYRTGDRVRWRHDGQLEFLGRGDTQVSVRGFRVEIAEIEGELARHPAVHAVVVNARADQHGDMRLTAYIVRSEADRQRDERARRDRVSYWQSLYDTTYGGSAAVDPAFDITGWHSSYTGLPIPAHEMREWVEATVERLRRRQPRRILEVGVGTGLLLHRLAPHCEEYVGVDFSEVVLDRVRDHVRTAGLTNVRLVRAAADALHVLGDERFDAVVLNSITQYFPGAEYLSRVIDGALSRLRPGGFVFIGDVRSLPLQRAFNLSVELHRASASMPVPQLLNRARTGTLREEELLVAPRFFTARAGDPRVSDVRVLMKRGRHDNELTRFRYDVFLDSADPRADRPTAPTSPWLDWERDAVSLDQVWHLLKTAAPDALVVRNVPNVRLRRETVAARLVADPAAAPTVADIRHALLSRLEGDQSALALDALDERAATLGYSFEPLWPEHGADGAFDIELRRIPTVTTRLAALPTSMPVRGGSPWPSAGNPAAISRAMLVHTNDPLQFSLGRELIPELRRWVRDRLPEYMVPGSYVFLDALPLTGNGKVDRHLLPDPAVSRDTLDGEFIAPRTPVEEVIAGLWTELLGSDRVGVRDNFFELGGHSLLGMQLIARLRDAFRVDLPVSAIFDAPTVEALAAVLADRAGTADSIVQLAQLTLAVARMSDDEVAARLKESGQP